MKKRRQIAALLALGAIIIPLSLSACSSTESHTSQGTDTTVNSSEDESPENTGGSNIQLDSYKEQIAYYMALSESLKEELLILKEEKYVESCEKDLKIAELQKTISSLQKVILTMSEQEKDKLYPSLDQMVSTQDYEYTVSDEGIIITKYAGNEAILVVPAEINGLTVREIGDGAFKGSDVCSVTLPQGMCKIGWFAFEGCTQLESVYIPSSVLSIGHGAFGSCPSSMKIICEEGSYAASFAQSWGIGVTLK